MFRRGASLALVLLMVLTLASTATAPARAVTQADIDKLQSQADDLARQKKETQEKLNALSGDKAQALTKKQLLDQQISVLSDQIDNVEEQIEDYADLISQTEAELSDAQQKEQAQYELFCQRVRAMEENGKISYWSVLFKATSFTDLLSRLDFVNEVMEYDQGVIDKLQALQEEISAKKADLESEKAKSEAAKSDLVSKKSELNAQRDAAVDLMKQIEQNQADYKDALQKMADEEDEINNQIAEMSRKLSAGNATYGGYIWPETVSKRITSPFGRRVSPGGIGSTNHQGVDIGGVGYTTQILAAKAGTVIISQYSSSYGNYVVLSHGNGNTTLYAHMSSRKVKVGDVVKQGQVIGITGCTGHSTGPHLHFGITENGEWIDPLKYLTDYSKSW